VNEAGESWRQLMCSQYIVACRFTCSDIEIFMEIFCVYNLCLSHQSLIDWKIWLMPNLTVLYVTLELNLRRKRSCFLWDIDDDSYTFKMIVWLTEYDEYVSNIENMVLSEGEVFLWHFMNFSPDSFKISIKDSRMHLLSHLYFMIAAVAGATFFQNPLFAVSKLVFILTRRKIYGCKIGVCGCMESHFVRLFPVIPASNKVSVSFSSVMKQVRPKLRFVNSRLIINILRIKRFKLSHIDFFWIELIESFSWSCKGS